jgi:hypothetical protein
LHFKSHGPKFSNDSAGWEVLLGSGGEKCRIIVEIMGENCNCVSKPALPLAAYKELSAFKLYLNDTGLLGAMAKLSAKTLLYGDAIFAKFKGVLSEQFVFQ